MCLGHFLHFSSETYPLCTTSHFSSYSVLHFGTSSTTVCGSLLVQHSLMYSVRQTSGPDKLQSYNNKNMKSSLTRNNYIIIQDGVLWLKVQLSFNSWRNIKMKSSVLNNKKNSLDFLFPIENNLILKIVEFELVQMWI